MAAPAPAPSAALTLVDSHCHMVFRNFDDDLEAVAQRWRDAGVRALIHACVEPGEIAAIRALADRFPELRYAVGVHPLDTQHWHEQTAAELRAAALADNRVVAIGELGLDLYREANLDRQLAVLGPQLDLAVELDLPVIIHCRDAAAPMLELLAGRARETGMGIIMVMHDVNLARRYADRALLLFGDGSAQCGPVAEILDAPTLSRLYGHPLRRIDAGGSDYFIPE